MKYWEKLILNQRLNGKDGLTIPFIIGSQNFLKNGKKQTIEELIIDIVSNSSFEITLRLCLNLHTLILEKRKLNNSVFFPNYKNNKQSNLSVALIFKNEFECVEDIIKELKMQFQNIIDKETFSAQISYNQRIANWNRFSEKEDVVFINESFKRNKNEFINLQ